MAGALDPNWHRVVDLRPRLRLHAEMHRQVGRGGRIWYVMQDNQSGRYFRLSVAAHALLCLMDGRRTVGDIFARLAARLGPDRPSQSATVKLLVHLHQSDLLATPLPPDMAELDRRASGQARQKLWASLRNPLALRVPLWAPDRFLDATLPLVRFFCRPVFGLIALAIALTGATLATLDAQGIVNNVADRVFAAQNVLLLALLYPLPKALHEAGHAYAVKLGGGDVPEVGLMFLVLLPVPYVDASASAAFPDRWRRVAVGAAGMGVELVLAGGAAIAWHFLGPGLGRAVALDLMVLCGVSTLLFNGNPLLRFDGYYILCDLAAIPNLDTRARRHMTYLMRRYVLGMIEERSPAETPGEARWFVGYGVLSTIYRLGMILSISLIVATKAFFIGMAIALASLAQATLRPVWAAARFLFGARELRGRRPRAFLGAGVLAALVGLLLFGLRLPHTLVLDGVVWLPSDAIVRAEADGFVSEIAATPEAAVAPGQILFRLDDPVAAARVEVLAAEVAVQQGRFESFNQIDRVQARLAADELARVEAAYKRGREEIAGFDVAAPRAGRFVSPRAGDLLGRFVHKGDVLGYVLGQGASVQAVAAQADLDLARAHVDKAAIRLAEWRDRDAPARVTRQTPSALEAPPAPALAPQGGGPMLLDPHSPHRDKPLDAWYDFEVAPLEGADALGGHIGEHASVRFDLGAEPVAWRVWRWARQAVLGRLGV